MSLNAVMSLLGAILVLLLGTFVNGRVRLLSNYNIPDPITGGMLFAAAASLLAIVADFRVSIDTTIKPLLLLMFFAGTGMTADLGQLKKGGKALAVFLAVLVPFIALQNLAGILGAWGLDLHPIFGLVAGSITLVGGHGTGAAYAERFADVNNLQSVLELSMTSATIGLILGGILGGPVAQFLIVRNKLGAAGGAGRGASDAAESQGPAPPAASLRPVGTLGSLAGILAAVLAGGWLAERFAGAPIMIPQFLWCMVLGVALRNLLPFSGVRFDDRASDLIAGICLSLFLVMTMMTLDLADVARSAGPILAMVALQAIVIAAYAVWACFRFMGSDYEASVTSSAFIGFCMGSTATAMANMKALTEKYGPAPTSFLIVPLAGAFFVDLANAVILTGFLSLRYLGG
jgi:ESS family glutamate:Na+ symporter